MKGNREVLEGTEYTTLLWGHPPCQVWGPESTLQPPRWGTRASWIPRAGGSSSRSPAQRTGTLPAACGGGGWRRGAEEAGVGECTFPVPSTDLTQCPAPSFKGRVGHKAGRKEGESRWCSETLASGQLTENPSPRGLREAGLLVS